MDWKGLGAGLAGFATGGLIPGAIALGGSIWQNNQNKQQAQKQMDFQERMSSTAAQRSVLDYAHAGLNPALAYERTATTPGGAAATIGNPIDAALSNARQSGQLKQSMKIAQAQNLADLEVKKTAAGLNTTAALKAAAEANLAKNQDRNAVDQGALLRQQLQFNAINQPFDLRMRAANAILQESNIPGATNTANYERLLGTAGKGIATARTLSEIIKMLNPRDFFKP